MLQIFSIRDLKAEAFNRPFISPNPALAMRELTTVLNTPDNGMKKYAEDFSLFLIGDFDEATGQITALNEPHHICSMLDLVEKD